MALADTVRQLYNDNADKALANSAKAAAKKIADTEAPPPSDIVPPGTNPKLDHIREVTAMMAQPEFWEKALHRMNALLVTEDCDELADLLINTYARQEMIYLAYTGILADPLNMAVRLQKLKDQLRAYDKGQATLAAKNIDLFADMEVD